MQLTTPFPWRFNKASVKWVLKPNWHLFYYLLAAVNIGTITASLSLNHYITNTYDQSIQINHQWAERTEKYSQLGEIISQINVPGNDVFVSGNIVAESKKLDEALKIFQARMKELKQDLQVNVDPTQATHLLKDLNKIEITVSEMVDEANTIFFQFEKKHFQLAAERMALMDRKYRLANNALADLRGDIAQIQKNFLQQQDHNAQRLRLYAYCIAPLIVLIASSIALYGYKLSEKLESDSQEKGQLIWELQQTESTLKEQSIQLRDTLQKLQSQTSQLIQSEKMSSLGEVTAGIAHEINNPVNFVHGNLTHADTYMQDLLRLIHLYQAHYPNPPVAIQQEIETIDLEFLEEDLGKLLRSMQIGTDRIREIVKSLRTFSRLDEAEVKAVNIHEGIDSTLTILHHRLKANSFHPEIKIIKQYESLPLVECYPGQLNQVFMNLLANAIDALEESGQPSPVITIRTEVKGHDRILIHFADNGSGMEEATLARLFTPFFTTKPVGKGTGLGLSISYQIVTEKHRGSLRCLSTPGKGSEFTIEVPRRQPHTS